MLLCVGAFFDGTPECKQQWKEFLEGKETGEFVAKLEKNCIHVDQFF